MNSFQELYPQLNPEELQAASENFDRYIEIAWNIFLRMEEERFDKSSNDSYDDGTKVDFLN